MKYLKAILGLMLIPFCVRIFYPNKIFNRKKIAIVGAADSVFKSENGKIIDSYDYVIRINKALVTWNKENEKFTGKRTDMLFHNFHENMDRGGGGILEWELFENFGLKYLVQSKFDMDGWRNIFNYFKKYLDYRHTIHILPRRTYRSMKKMFKQYHPTKGFCALYTVLCSNCEEIFITGFTFFKTPYSKGYREAVQDVKTNKIHIKNKGMHNIDMEYDNFLRILQQTKCKKVFVDRSLYEIINKGNPKIIKRVNMCE